MPFQLNGGSGPCSDDAGMNAHACSYLERDLPREMIEGLNEVGDRSCQGLIRLKGQFNAVLQVPPQGRGLSAWHISQKGRGARTLPNAEELHGISGWYRYIGKGA